jgi:DnaA family protein
MKQIPLAISPQPAQSFDSLLVGPNAQAVQHLRSLALPAPPVYLWGPTGSGKTHLLRALAEHRMSLGEQVGWFDADDALPWTLEGAWSLVVVDGCDRLDADHQQAAFALFVEAGTQGVQWAASGRVPPVDLPVRDDLLTRLGWGHVFQVQALAEAETRAVLRREADRRGIFLSDDVMGHLLTRFQRDLKHLMGLLDHLDKFALAEQREVTVPLLKKMLAETPPQDTDMTTRHPSPAHSA